MNSSPEDASPALAPSGYAFRRSTDDRVLLGVCGGLARRLGISPLIVRVGFVLLGLTSIGLAVYVLLAIAVPSDDQPGRVPAIRVGLALVAALGVLALSAAALHAISPGRLVAGRALPIVLLAAVGAALVIGRRAPVAVTGSETTGERAWRLPDPPVLLLLTVATSVMAATAAWLSTDGPTGQQSLGVILAVALIVVGLGVTLSAWRGRSFVLLPLGVVLSVPLLLAAFGNVSLTIGRDDPGVISTADGPSRTVVLSRGAGPVQVRAAAVTAGLHTLVVRKGVGRIEVAIDRSVPVEFQFTSAVARLTIEDAASGFYDGTIQGLRFGNRHSLFLPGKGPHQTATLTLQIDIGFGSVLVQHGVPTVTVPSVTTTLKAERSGVVQDIAARSHLLHMERRDLHKLTLAYGRQLSAMSRAGGRIGKGTLKLPESFWTTIDPSSNSLTRIDPTIALLDRLQLLRFNLLRAAWRVHAVEQGLAGVRHHLVQLDHQIAATTTHGGSA
jgi:phage shock protein PspC (stress-responsive transcriptional regulator)